MVGSCDYKNVTRQVINLKEKGADDALYLACVVDISPLLTKGVKLIEEKDAGSSSDVVKKPSETYRCLAKIATNHPLITNYDHRKH